MKEKIIIRKIEEYEMSMTEYQKFFYKYIEEFPECNVDEIKNFFEEWDSDAFIANSVYPDYKTCIEIVKGEK